MKVLWISVISLFLLAPASLRAQQDEILGVWYNEEKDGKIEVYKKNGKYYGEIIWIENDENDDGTKPKTDRNNPDPKKRSRRIVGTKILKDLRWDAFDQEWDDGEIYDPKSGKTYSVYAKMKGPNTLYLKGYIGISLIGRSTLWTRAE